MRYPYCQDACQGLADWLWSDSQPIRKEQAQTKHPSLIRGGGRDGPPGGGGGGGGGGGYGSYGGGGGGGQSSYGNSGGYNNQNSRGYNDGGYAQQAMPRHGEANGYAAQAPPPPSSTAGALVGPPAERKRKSRWGDENDKIQVAGLPTAISGDVSGKDLENYATHVRLEEISRKLKSGDVVPPERERSPSPPPTYDHHGRRTNTRDIRYRKKLEDERNKLVDKALRNDPNYKPPTEYLMQKRMSGRPQEKIFIPVKEFPEIKWIGLILGPRGNSLKAMEKDTGAKIVIRGKGSTKEGKGTFGNRSADEDDELHCNVTADSQDKVDACVRLINRVIATVRPALKRPAQFFSSKFFYSRLPLPLTSKMITNEASFANLQC